MSVLDNVTLAPRRVLKTPRAEAEAQATELLERFGLADKRDEYPDRLSGGQQQRVAIVRALAMKPDLLLLDEVTSALDPELVAEVLDVIRELAASGMTMLIATHEMGFARDIADRVCFLDAGTIIEQGPPDADPERPAGSRGRASSCSGSSRPGASSAGRPGRPRAASTKTLNNRSNAAGVDSVAFRVALDAEDEAAVGGFQPFDRSPAGLLAHALATSPAPGRTVERPGGDTSSRAGRRRRRWSGRGSGRGACPVRCGADGSWPGRIPNAVPGDRRRAGGGCRPRTR